MDPQLERDLHLHIDAILKDLRGWASATQPINILTLAFYNMGAEHTRCTSGPFPLSNFFSSLTAFNSLFLAYIRVEQLKLQRSMGGDVSKFNVLDRRTNAGFTGPGTPDEDPELFDEATGPTPCHPAD
jgi:hypothetical protein